MSVENQNSPIADTVKPASFHANDDLHRECAAMITARTTRAESSGTFWDFRETHEVPIIDELRSIRNHQEQFLDLRTKMLAPQPTQVPVHRRVHHIVAGD